jgi:GAF domain-containing protein
MAETERMAEKNNGSLPPWKELVLQVRRVVGWKGSRDEILFALCRLLKEKVGHYDWVGFYLVNESEQVLRVGPYAGAPTRHVKIPFGQGICGLAAQKRRSMMVPDVSTVANYLSCSPKVKSEFVVPVFAGDVMVAQLDVDSHTGDAFGEPDKEFLEQVAEVVAELF